MIFIDILLLINGKMSGREIIVEFEMNIMRIKKRYIKMIFDNDKFEYLIKILD
jgi:hypothetical protein